MIGIITRAGQWVVRFVQRLVGRTGTATGLSNPSSSAAADRRAISASPDELSLAGDAPACVDVLLLTAVRDEREVVLQLETDWSEATDPSGYSYHVRRDPGGLAWALARSVDMGPEYAANIATRLLPHLKPRCLAMVGVCAGWREKVRLGDVIVAERVFRYDAGKLIASRQGDVRAEEVYQDIRTYNFDPRWRLRAEDYPAAEWAEGTQHYPRPMPLPAQEVRLLERLWGVEQHDERSPRDHPERKLRCPDWTLVVQRLERRGLLEVQGGLKLTEAGDLFVQEQRERYPDGLPPDPTVPKSHVAPMGTGSRVMDDPDLFPTIQRFVRKTIAIDMESSAVAAVAEIEGVPYCLIVKSVQDHGDSDKDDRYRAYAVETSYRFLAAFLREQLAPVAPGVASVQAWEAFKSSLAPHLSAGIDLDDLVQDPEIRLELSASHNDGRAPNVQSLARRIGHLLAARDISLNEFAILGFCKRFSAGYYARFVAGVVGLLTDQVVQIRNLSEEVAQLKLLVSEGMRLQNVSIPSATPTTTSSSYAEELIGHQLERAKAHLDRGEFVDALQLLKELQERSEELGWTEDNRYFRRARLGFCHLGLASYSTAVELFAAAAELRPGDRSARLNLVIARHAAGDDASTLLEEVIRLQNGDALWSEAAYTRADLLISLNRADEAVSLLDKQARVLAEPDIRHDDALIRALLKVGQPDRALETARSLVAREGGEPEVHELLGLALVEKGIPGYRERTTSLIPICDIQIDPAALREAADEFGAAAAGFLRQGRTTYAVRCRVNEGFCLMELFETDGAKRAFNAAIDGEAPSNIRLLAFRGLGRIAVGTGDPTEAAGYFGLAYEADPSDIGNRFNYALALTQCRRWDEAEHQISELSKEDLPDELARDLRLEAISIRWGRGQRVEAERALEEHLRQHPDDWKAHLERVRWRMGADDMEGAVPCVEAALKVAPDNLAVLDTAVTLATRLNDSTFLAMVGPRQITRRRELGRGNSEAAYHNTANALILAGRPDAALSLLEEGALEGLDRGSFLEVKAHAHMARHEYGEAKACWEAMLAADQNCVSALRGLADTELKLDQPAAALRALKRAEVLSDADPRLLIGIAQMCSLLGSAQEAVGYAERAVQAGAVSNEQLMFEAINIAIAAGRRDLTGEWTQSFTQAWPESRLVQSYTSSSPEEVPEQLVEVLSSLRQRAENALNLYRERGLPLASLAHHTGRQLPELWVDITRAATPDTPVRYHSGDRQGLAAEQAFVLEATGPVIDAVALLTLDHLGLLHLLRLLFAVVLVPETTVERFMACRRYTQSAEVRTILDRIIGFVTSEPSIRRVSTPEAPSEGEDEWLTLLGPLGAAPVLVAQQPGVPLFSDDLAIVAEVRRRGSIGFSTLGLLGAAKSRGHLDNNSYLRAQGILFKAGYVVTPISAELIHWAFREAVGGDRDIAERMLGVIPRLGANPPADADVVGGTIGLLFREWPPGCEQEREDRVQGLLGGVLTADPSGFLLQLTAVKAISHAVKEGGLETAAQVIGAMDAGWVKMDQDPQLLATAVAGWVRHFGPEYGGSEVLGRMVTAACSAELRQLVEARIGEAPILRRESIPNSDG